MRRWLRQSALPIAIRYLVLLTLVVVTGLVFGEVLPRPQGDCFSYTCQAERDRAQDLLDLIF